MRLVQANVPQNLKFEPDGIARAFTTHLALMQGLSQGNVVDLVALPESIFPVPIQHVPPSYLQAFRDFAQQHRTAVIFGVFLEEPRGRYFNSAVGYGINEAPDDSSLRRYSKRHLVPFGEFIPPGFRWFVDMMKMPIGDQQRGTTAQPMALAGQQVAVNICYEDLFGAEIIEAWHSGGPVPTLMLNISNLAWFNDSLALPQHLQISRMRALETQHPMLRATNTGATAIIDARGEVAAQLPYRDRECLGRAGAGLRRDDAFYPLWKLARAVVGRTVVTRGTAEATRRSMTADPYNPQAMMTFQETILRLQAYWSEQGCALLQPLDLEVGAGTSHPATFLRAIGPEPWRAAYVQPSRRPKDARYGENPNRLHQHHQYQVVLKPSPPDILDVYLGSLHALGIDTLVNDIRFVEDNWENPTLGAWGLGWEVWMNGMEITQFTYFQQVGGLECKPITGEITYGLERLDDVPAERRQRVRP